MFDSVTVCVSPYSITCMLVCLFVYFCVPHACTFVSGLLDDFKLVVVSSNSVLYLVSSNFSEKIPRFLFYHKIRTTHSALGLCNNQVQYKQWIKGKLLLTSYHQS